MPRMRHLEPAPDLAAGGFRESGRGAELPERHIRETWKDLALVALLIRWPVVPVPGPVGAPDFLRLAGASPVRDGRLERLPGFAGRVVEAPHDSRPAPRPPARSNPGPDFGRGGQLGIIEGSGEDSRQGPYRVTTALADRYTLPQICGARMAKERIRAPLIIRASASCLSTCS